MPLSPLAIAWQHTQEFWVQTLAVIGRHPVAVLICGVVPAAERAYVLVRGERFGRGVLALLEGLVMLWRILLCSVAVWAACSGQEWQALRAQVGAAAAWQVALGRLGFHLAHHLRMVLWELLFFFIGFLLFHQIVVWCVRAVAVRNQWLREPRHQRAVRSILRNLILAPMAVIYLVEMARPAFQ